MSTKTLFEGEAELPVGRADERESFVVGVMLDYSGYSRPEPKKYLLEPTVVWDELLYSILHVGTAHVQCTMVQKHGGRRR